MATFKVAHGLNLGKWWLLLAAALLVVTLGASSGALRGTIPVLVPQYASQQTPTISTDGKDAAADATDAAAPNGAAAATNAADPAAAASDRAAGPQMVPTAQAVAAAAGLHRTMPVYGSRASRWQPVVLSVCTDDMPRHFAPCLVGNSKDPALVYGEELVYPAFSLAEPRFVNQEHAEWWRETARPYVPDRFTLRTTAQGIRGVFPAQHGQNLVFRNVTYSGTPPHGSWGGEGCMNQMVAHRGLTPLPPGEAPTWPRAVLANTPDSYSLQHFLDRVTKIMMQTEGWREEGTRIVSGSPPSSEHVKDVWDLLLDGGKQQAEFGVPQFSAAEMVFSCRCPMVHPFHHERLRELMNLPEPAPLEERKVVMFMSRNQDSGGNSGGRQVTNEEAVLKAIKDVLKERNLGEELKVYNRDEFPHVMDLAKFMFANVSAIVGPHGGALYNVWWSAPGTMVLEFLPKERFGTLFWEEGSMAGQRYVCIPTPSNPPDHNMEVNPEFVAKALQENLGVAPAGPAEPQPFYDWDLGQILKR